MARQTTAPATWPIAIDRAFRWVVACSEEADGVDPSLRLGLLPGQDDPHDSLYAPVATGPEYARRFKSAAQPWARRGGQPPPPPQPGVPRTPDAEQLAVILRDRETAGPMISPAELRICLAHDWLIRALQDGLIAASGDAWIEPRNGTPTVLLESGAGIEAHLWKQLAVDYALGEAVGRDDNFRAERGLTITGRLVFVDVRLDGGQLEVELRKTMETEPPVEVSITASANGHDAYEIGWEGRMFTIGVERRERVNRAMRAFAILLRNPNESIAYHLLENLSRRDVDTRVQSDADRKKARNLGEEISELSQRLYREEISLAEAHRSIDEILARDENEGPLLRTWAPWAPSYEESAGRIARKPSKAYETVVENVRLSIRLGLKAIHAAGATEAAEYLEKMIIRGRHAARFDPTSSGTPQRRRR